jgi:hypothetical protein
MLGHTSCGNSGIILTSYNIKYTSSPHNMRSLASRPRIRQLYRLRSIGHKARKKDRIEVYFIENKARLYILVESQRSTDWFQHVVNSPIISFSVCNRGFGAIARIIRSQKEPKRRANQIMEVIYGKYNWNRRPIVELTPQSDTVRYTR